MALFEIMFFAFCFSVSWTLVQMIGVSNRAIRADVPGTHKTNITIASVALFIWVVILIAGATGGLEI